MTTVFAQPSTDHFTTSYLDLQNSSMREPDSMSYDDPVISPIDCELNSQYFWYGQNIENFLPDLSRGSFPASAASQDPPTSVQLPSDYGSSYQTSSELSSSPNCATCPIDQNSYSPTDLLGGCPDKSCVLPPLWAVKYRAANPSFIPESSRKVPIASSSGKRYSSHPKARKLGGKTTLSAPCSNEAAQHASAARTAHSAVERRYRNNLNVYSDKLQALLAAAATTDDPHHPGGDPADADKAKTKKAAVLLGAIEYVKRSEREKQESANTNRFLKQRVVALEKLVKCEDCSLLKQMNLLSRQASNMPIGVPDT